MKFLKNRRLWAWSMYDFANSAYATTILSVVFNVYFAKRVVPPEGVHILGTDWTGTALWAGLVTGSTLILFLLSPLLGAAADLRGNKKSFLTTFWATGVAGTAGLFFAGPGDVAWASACFFTANTGFAGGNVFYNALLTDVAAPREMGRVSGLGWAAGYLGGGLCLGLNLAFIKFPAFFGLAADADLPVRACLLSVAAWWLLFGAPLALTRFPATRMAGGGESLLKESWSRLAATARQLKVHKNLLLFMAAYLLYNDGIETVILMASLAGAEILGMGQDELILCFLMIQGVAFVGALLFGALADRWGHKKSILAALGVYAVALFWGAAMTKKADFWALGVVVGLVLGGSQAASRSLMGLFTPADRSAELFSFYGVASKLSSALGPAVYGLTRQFWGPRAAILSLLIFFAAGGAVLATVQEPKTTDRA